MKPVLLFLSLFLIAGSCEIKEVQRDPVANEGSRVDFYYLEEEKIDGYQMQIDESTASIADTVLIAYEEILSYNAGNYTFTVTDEVLDRLDYYRTFALTVDTTIIYTGYFWTSLSSRIVDWVVIDLLPGKGNELQVQLGYPGSWEGLTIPDRRNDPRILAVFRRDGKLIE